MYPPLSVLPARVRRPMLRCLRLVTLLGLMASVVPAQAAPRTAASIVPLQHILAAIDAGVTQPGLILSSQQDPHHAALKPSERQALAQADLVLWVGPILELPLQGAIGQSKAVVLSVQQMPGILRVTRGRSLDPHLWLNTDNARIIAGELARALSQLDPAHRGEYEANLAQFLGQLDALDAEVQAALSAKPVLHWAVYHDAFAYLALKYRLPEPLRLRDSDDNEPGIRSVMAFRGAMQAQGIDCLISEPGIDADNLRSMLGAHVRVQQADILGYDLAPTATSYAALVSSVIAAIQACNGGQHE